MAQEIYDATKSKFHRKKINIIFGQSSQKNINEYSSFTST
jgi:hypothetical protein